MGYPYPLPPTLWQRTVRVYYGLLALGKDLFLEQPDELFQALLLFSSVEEA